MTMLNTREEVADWLDKYGIKNYEISECLVVNAMGGVDLSERLNNGLIGSAEVVIKSKKI